MFLLVSSDFEPASFQGFLALKLAPGFRNSSVPEMQDSTYSNLAARVEKESFAHFEVCYSLFRVL